MKIIVKKLTNLGILREACESTLQADQVSNISLDSAYKCEHSPMRTQLFWLTMEDIPTFVSVHCVRHKIGIEHFVRSNRPDRGGNAKADRETLVMHSALLNAEAFIAMAKKRLCGQASTETQELMIEIKKAVALVDSDLAAYMVPNCVYRGGLCVEPKPCGKYKVRKYNPSTSIMDMEMGWHGTTY